MKITGVSVQVVDAGVTMVFADRLIMNLANVIVRVQTDDGIEGVAGSSTYLGARAVAAALAELRPLLIGEDPLYRERIWQRLNEVSILMVPPHSLALVDCALWDLAGRAAGLPVYKLLGAQRDELPAYASSLTYATHADFQREVEAWLEHGFRAIKLHVWGDPDRDIELCTAVRAQVGPGIAKRLGMLRLTYVGKIRALDPTVRTIETERRAEGGVQVLPTRLLCLITILEATN